MYGKSVQPADGRAVDGRTSEKQFTSAECRRDIVSLRDVIESDKSTLLGEAVAKRFGELPFLFKVLCAAQPLSIQVHPNKHNSEIGFAKENAAGIPMDAAERNYKDPNHKPELVFALTPFLAMNAFREFSEIVSLLQPSQVHIRRCSLFTTA
ncbi:mannose-6-phosphate isomerase [Escherichia coli]|uniref:mannose-6-phosphate isomerase n=1 Tax=Escherichia coli TaxID=562 RepID=A0A2X1KEU8_ECOLX|nr:mannose-6-phosphate isomerase [Escherichia coli]